jgi:hypothetical protein
MDTCGFCCFLQQNSNALEGIFFLENDEAIWFGREQQNEYFSNNMVHSRNQTNWPQHRKGFTIFLKRRIFFRIHIYTLFLARTGGKKPKKQTWRFREGRRQDCAFGEQMTYFTTVFPSRYW